jgi:hypothetical protein
MHTFKVIKDRNGWLVLLGEGMMMPFRTQQRAIEEAQSLCDALHSHGQRADVVIECPEVPESAATRDRLTAVRRAAEPRNARPLWR